MKPRGTCQACEKEVLTFLNGSDVYVARPAQKANSMANLLDN